MEALTLRDIKEKLHSLFGEDNRLVFWYDGEGDFEDTVDTLVPDDVAVLRLTGRNAFRAKLRLEHEDPDGRYLIYAPFTKPDVRQNVLEDTLLYSKEFYADQLSYLLHGRRPYPVASAPGHGTDQILLLWTQRPLVGESTGRSCPAPGGLPRTVAGIRLVHGGRKDALPCCCLHPRPGP